MFYCRITFNSEVAYRFAMVFIQCTEAESCHL